jgi:hypothetical protein
LLRRLYLESYQDRDDAQQVARHIEDARAIYKAPPDLVLLACDELDAEIKELAE